MKLALIADIHSNYIALKSGFNYIDQNNIDSIIFLGDYLSDCPYPQRTMRLLYEYRNKYDCYFIRGNREDYLLSHHKNPNDGWCYASSSGSLLYTYNNITSEDINFFDTMPICMTIRFDGCPPITVCHGSPNNTKEWIMGKDELLSKYSENLDTDYLFCGHTHRTNKSVINGKQIVFCPSIGLPTNKNTDAQFIILESINDVWIDTIISIPYDRQKLICDFKESGLYNKAFVWASSIVKILETGVN